MNKKHALSVLALLFVSLHIHPEDEPKKKTAWTYYVEKDYATALKMLEEEKKYYPERVNIYIIMGWCYRNQRQYYQMERISREGMKIGASHYNVVRNLAESLYFQGKYGDAIEHFEKYLELRYTFPDPYLSTVYLFLGYSYLQAKFYNKADIALSMANTRKPNQVITLLFLAETNEALQKKEKAYEYYQLILKLNPSHQKAIEGANRTKSNV